MRDTKAEFTSRDADNSEWQRVMTLEARVTWDHHPGLPAAIARMLRGRVSPATVYRMFDNVRVLNGDDVENPAPWTLEVARCVLGTRRELEEEEFDHAFWVRCGRFIKADTDFHTEAGCFHPERREANRFFYGVFRPAAIVAREVVCFSPYCIPSELLPPSPANRLHRALCNVKPEERTSDSQLVRGANRLAALRRNFLSTDNGVRHCYFISEIAALTLLDRTFFHEFCRWQDYQNWMRYLNKLLDECPWIEVSLVVSSKDADKSIYRVLRTQVGGELKMQQKSTLGGRIQWMRRRCAGSIPVPNPFFDPATVDSRHLPPTLWSGTTHPPCAEGLLDRLAHLQYVRGHKVPSNSAAPPKTSSVT